MPIRFLIGKINSPFEETMMTNKVIYRFLDGLLKILHAGRLHANHPSFEDGFWDRLKSTRSVAHTSLPFFWNWRQNAVNGTSPVLLPYVPEQRICFDTYVLGKR
jgi:hypothetical protein